MASADELIREAQYAFRNIGHGSTDARKYKARAEKYARRIIRKFPVSVEASQARQILAQLNLQIPAAPQTLAPPVNAAADFEKSHSADFGHTTNLSPVPVSFDAALQQSGMTDDWRNLIRRFMDLPRGKKKTIGIVVFFAIVFFFPIGIFFVSGLAIFYATQPPLLKKHLEQMLNRLESK